MLWAPVILHYTAIRDRALPPRLVPTKAKLSFFFAAPVSARLPLLHQPLQYCPRSPSKGFSAVD